MNFLKHPFFFFDEKFISDVLIWKELLNKASEEADRLQSNILFEKECLNNEESEKVIAFCLTAVKAQMLFITMGTNILTKIFSDQNRTAEYSLFASPTSDVVNAQIYQYILPDLSLEECLQMVRMQKETINRVNEFVKKNTTNF